MLNNAPKPAPARAPDLTGPAGEAWRLDVAKGRALAEPNPNDSTVECWAVYAPHSHPFWPTVMISLIHLREVEGQTQAPVLYLAGATHEIAVLALNPEKMDDVTATIDGKAYNLPTLSPPNFVGQFVALNDVKASERIEKTVADIVNGLLNPDTDALQQWVGRFGDHGLKLSARTPASQARN